MTSGCGRVDRPGELHPRDTHDLPARAGRVAVGNVEDRAHAGARTGRRSRSRARSSRGATRSRCGPRRAGACVDWKITNEIAAPSTTAIEYATVMMTAVWLIRRDPTRCAGGSHIGLSPRPGCGIPAADRARRTDARCPCCEQDRVHGHHPRRDRRLRGGGLRLDAAISLAAETGDEIAAVTVWRALQGDFGLAYPSAAMLDDLLDAERRHAEAALEEATARAEAAGVRIRTRLATGDPAEQICAYAEEIDARLIAIGTRGYGTVASSCSAASPMPSSAAPRARCSSSTSRSGPANRPRQHTPWPAADRQSGPLADVLPTSRDVPPGRTQPVTRGARCATQVDGVTHGSSTLERHGRAELLEGAVDEPGVERADDARVALGQLAERAAVHHEPASDLAPARTRVAGEATRPAPHTPLRRACGPARVARRARDPSSARQPPRSRRRPEAARATTRAPRRAARAPPRPPRARRRTAGAGARAARRARTSRRRARPPRARAGGPARCSGAGRARPRARPPTGGCSLARRCSSSRTRLGSASAR